VVFAVSNELEDESIVWIDLQLMLEMTHHKKLCDVRVKATHTVNMLVWPPCSTINSTVETTDRRTESRKKR
jgi:hypothetical protein